MLRAVIGREAASVTGIGGLRVLARPALLITAKSGPGREALELCLSRLESS